MNFLRRLGIGLKAMARPESYVWTPGQAQWSGWDYRAVAEEGYACNPYLYRAVRQIQVASAGIKVWGSRYWRGEWKPLPDASPAAQLLRNPAPRTGWPAWVESEVGMRCLGGQAFALAVGPGPNGDGQPRELHPVTPDKMAVIPGAYLGDVRGFAYRPKATEIVFPPERVFWWPAWHPMDAYSGQADAQAAARSIDTNNSALSFNKALLENGGAPGTIFTTDSQSFGPDQARELVDSFKANHGGPRKAGKFMVLWGGLKPHKFGLTPQELSWADGIQVTARQVALCLGVPPELLGDGSQKTFSNYREARAALYTETVLPLLDDLCAGLSASFTQWFGEPIRIAPDTDDVEALSGLRAEKWGRVIEAWTAGLLTLDEALTEIGYEPVGGQEGEARRAQPSQVLQFAQPGGKVFTGHAHGKDGKCLKY